MLEEAASHQDDARLLALTPRELEVLEMIASGMTNAETGERLQLSVHAIKFHLAEIYRRLAVSNRTEAAVAYLRLRNGTQEANQQVD